MTTTTTTTTIEQITTTTTTTTSKSVSTTTTTTTGPCTACNDKESSWMKQQGHDCTTSDQIQKKCNKDSGWMTEKWCQQSCFDAGFGYPGDNCCPVSATSTTSKPTAATTTASCTVC